MKLDILTLFPKMFEGILHESIIKRAIEKNAVEIRIIDFREFSKLNNHQVDDTPYGGGSGMVLRCEPLVEAIEAVKDENSKVLLMCPQGKPYKEADAIRLSKEKHLVIVCGHYEGYDERIRNFVDEEISIGDYVLTGGEIPAMAVMDSIIRLLPGVIKEDSFKEDSFTNGLLDYPTYTKPASFRGLKVPDVLFVLDDTEEKAEKLNELFKQIEGELPDEE